MPSTFTGTFTANSVCLTNDARLVCANGIAWTASKHGTVATIGGCDIGGAVLAGEAPCQ